jgi:hypothetical protein
LRPVSDRSPSERIPSSAKDDAGTERADRRSRRAAAAIPLAALAALVLFDLPTCPSRVLLGIPCPGCGLTRATRAMLSLDWAAMWRFHPLAPVIVPFVVALTVAPLLRELGALQPRAGLARAASLGAIVLAVAMVGVYALRIAGHLGGLPDPIDPAHGALARAAAAMFR